MKNKQTINDIINDIELLIYEINQKAQHAKTLAAEDNCELLFRLSEKTNGFVCMRFSMRVTGDISEFKDMEID